jgi:hypothetical protein
MTSAIWALENNQRVLFVITFSNPTALTNTYLGLTVVGKASHGRVLKLEVQNPELSCSEWLAAKNDGVGSAIEVGWVT